MSLSLPVFHLPESALIGCFFILNIKKKRKTTDMYYSVPNTTTIFKSNNNVCLKLSSWASVSFSSTASSFWSGGSLFPLTWISFNWNDFSSFSLSFLLVLFESLFLRVSPVAAPAQLCQLFEEPQTCRVQSVAPFNLGLKLILRWNSAVFAQRVSAGTQQTRLFIGGWATRRQRRGQSLFLLWALHVDAGIITQAWSDLLSL